MKRVQQRNHTRICSKARIPRLRKRPLGKQGVQLPGTQCFGWLRRPPFIQKQPANHIALARPSLQTNALAQCVPIERP
eukprot:scaffold47_cov334-Pavlova_lutheri.AAC.45